MRANGNPQYFRRVSAQAEGDERGDSQIALKPVAAELQQTLCGARSPTERKIVD
jgi:hypothetical protein